MDGKSIRLTAEEFCELRAIVQFVDAVKGPTFLMRRHWRGESGALARKGLVSWTAPHPEMGREFAAVAPTDAGRAFLRFAMEGPPRESDDDDWPGLEPLAPSPPPTG